MNHGLGIFAGSAKIRQRRRVPPAKSSRNALLFNTLRVDSGLVRFLHNRGTEANHEETNNPGSRACRVPRFCSRPVRYQPITRWSPNSIWPRPITLKGTLTRMEWVNPHGWLYVDVKGPEGPETWKIETGSPFRMEKRGLKKIDFRIGDEVIISGFASKDGTPTAAGMTITFPDREKSFPGSRSDVRAGTVTRSTLS